MVEYKCAECGKLVKNIQEVTGTVRCVACGHKIFFKARQPVARNVKAR